MAKQVKKSARSVKADAIEPASPFQAACAKLAAACVVYAVAVSVVFANVLFQSDRVLSPARNDIWRQFFPWRMFGFSELAKLHLALWNPYVFSGAPYLGGFQAALLYPPNWLFMILPMATAINAGIALHIFLAGVFMYCWAAYRRLHWVACLSAGLVYMFGGPEFGRVVPGHLTNIDTLTWAPLIFLALDDLTMTRSLRGALLGSAAFAMQIFAGHVQYAFYTALAATIYFALNLPRAPDRKRAIAGYLLCFGGGGLLASAQLFTGLGATAEAMRTHTTYEFASTFSFPPENLLTMLMPGFFGDPTTNPYSYWGRWFWWEATAYVGVVGFSLACCALLTPRRSRRWGLTMVVVTVLLAMGRYTPLFHIVYRLPGFSSFRGITKFMFLAVMFLAMLSALGLDALLAGGAKRVWPAAIIAGGSSVMLLSAWIINSDALDRTSLWGRMLRNIDWSDNHRMVPTVDADFLYHSATTAAGELCWAGMIGMLLAGLLLAGRWNRRALLAIPVLMSAELLAFANHYQPTFSLAQYEGEIEAVAQCLSPLPRDARVAAADQGQLFMAGRLNSWGDDPMMLRRYVEFIANSLGVAPDSLGDKPMRPRSDNRLLRMVRMAGVLILDEQGAHLSSLGTALLPRAELVTDVRVAPNRAQLLAQMNDPHFDPVRTAIVEAPIDPTPTGSADPGRVVVRDLDSDTVDVEAWTRSPSLLVITDSYSTGWHAEALPDSDEHQYQVIPTDLTLRGVPLETGHHHFRLVYRPLAFVIGKWTNLAAIMAYLTIAAAWWYSWRCRARA
jgi:hypothetical protein